MTVPTTQRAVLLAGGWMHPAEEPVRAVRPLLRDRGLQVDVVTEPPAVSGALASPCALLVVASCWFSMAADRYDDEQRARWAVGPDPDRERALDATARRGTPLLALHSAVISFDGSPVWSDWLGGAWSWTTSSHPPPALVPVVPEPGAPIEVEPFAVVDEEYRGLDLSDRATIVARSGAGHPLAWVRDGERRAAVDMLGHDARSLRDPGHRQLLTRLLDWLLDG